MASGKLRDDFREPQPRSNVLPTAARLYWEGRGLTKEALLRHVYEHVVTTDFAIVTKPPIWLWICGDKEIELKATQLAGKALFIANYVKKYSTYKPAKFEPLEDLPATNKSARAPISLLFLVRKSDKAKFNIPAIFQAFETHVYTKPRKYHKLQYRILATELWMKFYLHLFELFCQVGHTVYSVFNSTKILCAGLVSANHISIYIFAILLLSRLL